MSTSAIIMMVVVMVGYVAGFTFCLNKVFMSEKSNK